MNVGRTEVYLFGMWYRCGNNLDRRLWYLELVRAAFPPLFVNRITPYPAHTTINRTWGTDCSLRSVAKSRYLRRQNGNHPIP